jgi:prophage antirepressor-like protein
MTKPAATATFSQNLCIRADGLVPVVNSRDVAEVFGKAHDKVCRDIKALDISPDLATSWFRATVFQDSYGREQPPYDMTLHSMKGLNNNELGNTDTNIVNESGLYSLILTSRKPEAKRFKKWVMAEVLPSIRKTRSPGALANLLI